MSTAYVTVMKRKNSSAYTASPLQENPTHANKWGAKLTSHFEDHPQCFVALTRSSVSYKPR
jgi:hypothetical protein